MTEKFILVVNPTTTEEQKNLILDSQKEIFSELDPNGFYWEGASLMHSGKLNVVNAFLETMRKVVDNPHQYRPVRIATPSSKDEENSYANKYYLSKTGHFIQISDSSADAKKPYWNDNSHSFKFSMYDEFWGTRCQTVRTLLRNTWGDEVADAFIAKEEELKTILKNLLTD